MRRILIIDDEEGIRTLLRAFLESNGYEISEAGDGEAGLRMFRSAPVDLVITDILMPEKEGLATIMELKKESPGLKVIAISGGLSASPHYLNVSKKFGADRVFEKPMDLHALLEAVRELVG